MSRAPARLRIAFLHPDLGLGGAERLVLDAALALAGRGHRVTVFTAEYDPARAFHDASDPAIEVRVRGGGIPKHLGQHLRVPCSMARMAALAVAASREGPFDVVVCDLVVHVVPLIKALVGAPVLFYGHYPDRLLTPPRRGLYRGYRVPIDWLESHGLQHCDAIAVNSEFTARAFRRTFPALADRALRVVYPCVELPEPAPPDPPDDGLVRLLMVGRFSPHKNLPLLVQAGAELARSMPRERFARLRFVIAGGYDPALEESRKIERELLQIASTAGIADQLELHRSPDHATVRALFHTAACVVYTPTDEHLGIVPLEAMAARRAVIAANRGGPCETVLHGRTGLLCDPTPHAFAAAITTLFDAPEHARQMADAGRAHVATTFSRDTLAQRLEQLIRGLLSDGV